MPLLPRQCLAGARLAALRAAGVVAGWLPRGGEPFCSTPVVLASPLPQCQGGQGTGTSFNPPSSGLKPSLISPLCLGVG